MAAVELLTSKRLAELLGVTPQRIGWILKLCPDLKPKAIADGKPVFDSTVIPRLRYELNKRDARKREDDLRK